MFVGGDAAATCCSHVPPGPHRHCIFREARGRDFRRTAIRISLYNGSQWLKEALVLNLEQTKMQAEDMLSSLIDDIMIQLSLSTSPSSHRAISSGMYRVHDGRCVACSHQQAYSVVAYIHSNPPHQLQSTISWVHLFSSLVHSAWRSMVDPKHTSTHA